VKPHLKAQDIRQDSKSDTRINFLKQKPLKMFKQTTKNAETELDRE